MISDFFGLILSLVMQIWLHGQKTFFTVCVVGLLLSIGMWFLMHWIGFSFNRQIYARPQYYLFCSLAAVFTFVFTFLFYGLYVSSYASNVVSQTIEKWKTDVEQDRQWSQAVFVQAYEAVMALNNKDSRQPKKDYPHPDQGGTVIPASEKESQDVSSKIYAENAVKHFSSRHPLLSKILWATSEDPHQKIAKSKEEFFKKNPGKIYSLDKAVSIASAEILNELKTQLPRITLISQLGLIVIFLVVQGILISLLIYVALSDIKEPKLSLYSTGG